MAKPTCERCGERESKYMLYKGIFVCDECWVSSEDIARDARDSDAKNRYELTIVWKQPHGATSTWNYEGTPRELERELLGLAADLQTLPDYA